MPARGRSYHDPTTLMRDPLRSHCRGVPLRAPNRHQPKNKLITVRRGERGWAGRGGPLWSPASCSFVSPVRETDPPPHPAGDHKGPPNPTSSALAPTDHLAPCLTSRLRLMPIGVQIG